jgi:uncharacterized protein YecE (DUF72 family)
VPCLVTRSVPEGGFSFGLELVLTNLLLTFHVLLTSFLEHSDAFCSQTCSGILSGVMEARIQIGTSSFTAAGWSGSFYPKGLKSAEYLMFYAEHFNTVEIDSTFYACPSPSTVRGWAQKTLEDFIFAVKVPQTITHEKVLVDCDAEFEQFVQTMSMLGGKLGPIVMQFPYFNSDVFQTLGQFLSRLKALLKKIPSGYKLAVEIRNKHWLNDRLGDLLREHKVALVLQDREWMPTPTELAETFDPITTDWTYIRWLGDRKSIEQMTKTWDRTVVDRASELSSWVDYCQQVRRRGVTIFAYANNHFGGHAPATVRQFRELWRAKGLPALEPPRRVHRETSLSLFDEPAS